MKLAEQKKSSSPDSLGIYLKEISAYPQLSVEEEREVVRKVRDGDQDAFQKLIQSNLRFVVSMAKKYSRSGYPMHELINEGNLGLLKAAGRFDPDREVRFITYASWWVRQAILAAIARYGQVFSIPPKLKHELYRFETSVGRLTQELGHRPTVEEISDGLEMAEDAVWGMLRPIPSEVSLSTPLGADGDFEIEDLIADPNTAPQFKELLARSFEKQLVELLDQLDDRERYIVVRRFGLEEQEQQTLAQIGEGLGLSRERVRQIEARALGKLRLSRRARQLMAYLN